MARRTPPEENIPLIVYKPFVWRNFPPRKPAGPPPSDIPVMTAAPEPFDPPEPYTKYDGHFIGVDSDRAGCDYSQWTPLSKIHGVQPKGGHPTQKIIFVNGILNSPKNEYDSMQEIANQANAEVVGVYNATEGFWKDFAQCVKDKLGIGHNPAVETLKNTLYFELTSGSQQPINLMAHSQGALITSRALGEVRNQLQEDGLSPKEIDARMSRINVDTFGGAASGYPNGPHYNHYVNAADPVAGLFGRALPAWSPAAAVAAAPFVGAGAGAHTHWSATADIHAGNPVSAVHGFTEVYLKGWQSPFPRNAPQ